MDAKEIETQPSLNSSSLQVPVIAETPVESLREILEGQTEHFRAGLTRHYEVRRAKLVALEIAIRQYEERLIEALRLDLGKDAWDSYAQEIGMVLSEIHHAVRNLRRWMEDRLVLPDLHLLPGTAKVIPEPYGRVLIMAPWNYPVQLLLLPLVGAIAGGNTVLLKPSELCPRVSAVLAALIEEWYEPQAVALVQGGAKTADALLDLGWDKIFFTGSTRVGKIVAAKAAAQLIPCTLELGGKSPVIVDKSARLDHAAERIVWGKTLNAGQTCVAPDYVLVSGHERGEELLGLLQKALERFYGSEAHLNPEYQRVLNQAQFQRLKALISTGGQAQVFGGRLDEETLKIEPAFIYPAPFDHPAMEEEIFGPILPIIPVESLDHAIDFVRDRPTPLAAYLFSESRSARRKFREEVPAGNMAINTVLLQVSSKRLPFGGVGTSGTGSYHGKASFDCFTRPKSLLRQSSSFAPRLFYPQERIKFEWLRKILR